VIRVFGLLVRRKAMIVAASAVAVGGGVSVVIVTARVHTTLVIHLRHVRLQPGPYISPLSSLMSSKKYVSETT
jgi:hypothetical protein